ncbi:MAG TPA: hypothetical protein VEX86_13615 [Longimicrobium sp.]|nr:hypothetical protein [Longimicrobium sp.]
MRNRVTLLLAIAVIVAVVAWWTRGDPAVSVVPGWHTPILAPYALIAISVSAVLLMIAFVVVFKQIRGRKRFW